MRAPTVTPETADSATPADTDQAKPEPSTPAATTVPQPSATQAPPLPLPAPVGAQTLAWRSCGEAECAQLEVPLDHQDPTGDTLQLAVMRIAATSPDPLGSLIVNPGGPGGSGINFLPAFALIAPETLRARFDLVSWDPRGVGQSSGLVCNANPADELNAVADTRDGIRAEIDAAVQQSTELGEACLASEPDLLAHVGTRASARDLDLLRAALGQERLHYLGYSYGTRLGTVYATLFPETVERMVLDGAFPPGLSSTELALKAADLEAVLKRIDHVCDLEASCRVANPGLLATYNELLSTASVGPSDTSLGLSNRAAVIGATLLATYVPPTWESYADALHLAANGDYTGVHDLARRWYGDGSGNFDSIFRGANTAIMCADDAYAATLSQTTVDAEAALQASPVLGEALFGSTCSGWPVLGKPLPPIDTDGSAEVLVIGGRYDPATPLRWAERLAAELHDASLLRYLGDGHTAFARGNECVDSAVVHYLLGGSPPRDGAACAPASGTLGIRVSPAPNGLEIQEVAPSSPLAGRIQIGHVITKRNGKSTTGDTVLQSVAGERVELTIQAGTETFIVTTKSQRRPWHHPAD